MKKEIIGHVKNLKDQGIDVKVDEDQINDLINKIFDKNMKNMKKKTYIEYEIDKFLEKLGDKNIYISYDKDKDTGKYKNIFDTEEIIRSLKKLCNKFINFDEFNEEYNKFTHNVTELKDYKCKNKSSFSSNQKRMERCDRDLKNIVIFIIFIILNQVVIQVKKGEGLKILTNKQMLNRLPVLLANTSTK